MSHSKSLVSGKGLLGNIWMAAYFSRKLKKKQIANTDIPSYIDEILPDPEIPYRTLTLLLLGVVKIFSKKVDLLYNDCNSALTTLNKSLIGKQLMVRNEVTSTSRRKVSKKGIHAQKCKVSESLETTQLAGEICQPYDDTPIVIPERFELDSFDLGIPEDGDIVESHEDYNIKDGRSADRSPLISLNESYHEATTSHAGFSSCFTALDDVLPPYMMNIDEEISKIYKSDDSEAGGEDFGGDFDNTEDCNDDESMVAEDIVDSIFFNMERGNQEHSDKLDEIISKVTENNLNINQPEIHVEPTNLFETTTSESHKDHPEGPTEDQTSVEIQDNVTRGQDPVITPANKEKFRLLRKKNRFFDQTTILSDNSHFGWSDLRRTRKKAPLTRLQVWKVLGIANVEQGFMQPLLTGLSPELKTLYKDKLSNPLSSKRSSKFLTEQAEPSGHTTESVDLKNVTEPVDLMNVDEPSNLENVTEPVNVMNVAEPVNMHIDDPDNIPLEDIPTQEKSHADILIAGTPAAPTAFELYNMTQKSRESSSLDYGLDAMDGDLDSDGGYSNEQEEHNIWSDKTRAVAQFFHKKLASDGEREEKKTIKLSSVLQGSTRTTAAKFFYETMALKNLGCINATQESPYTDIVLSTTPQLEKMIDKC